MLDSARDNAIANHKTYGNVEAQHRLFGELRRDDLVHWCGVERGRSANDKVDQKVIRSDDRSRTSKRNGHGRHNSPGTLSS